MKEVGEKLHLLPVLCRLKLLEHLKVTTFWSSIFPVFNAKTGVIGEGIGAASEESASNFLVLENPWNNKKKNMEQTLTVKQEKI